MYIDDPKDAKLVIDFNFIHVLYKSKVIINDCEEKEAYIVQGYGDFCKDIEERLLSDVVNCWCAECPQVIFLLREHEVIAFDTLQIVSMCNEYIILSNSMDFPLLEGEMQLILEHKIKAHNALKHGKWEDAVPRIQEIRPYKALPPAKDSEVEAARKLIEKMFNSN